MRGRAVDARRAELDPLQRLGIVADRLGVLGGIEPVAGDQDFRFRQRGGDRFRFARPVQLGARESLQGVFETAESAAEFQKHDAHVLAFCL